MTQVIINYGNDEDSDLTKAAARGDKAAFEEIYSRYHGRVYSICLRMLQNTAEAEDLMQDVFILLFRKIGSFRGDSAFTTWLHRMTVNQVLNHFRKRTVKLKDTSGDNGSVDSYTPVSRNPRNMQFIDKLVMDDAIKMLPDECRNVFVLHDVEGFDHGEVARILGCTVGISKDTLYKARRILRKSLMKS